MSYIEFVKKAQEKIRVMFAPLDANMSYLGGYILWQWKQIEFSAKSVNYDVLSCDEHLRTLILAIAASLYDVEGASFEEDERVLRKKDAEYGGSWQRRGGIGAFFAAVRKVDRLENSLKTFGDLRKALDIDGREEGVRDDIGDLRRYLVI